MPARRAITLDPQDHSIVGAARTDEVIEWSLGRPPSPHWRIWFRSACQPQLPESASWRDGATNTIGAMYVNVHYATAKPQLKKRLWPSSYRGFQDPALAFAADDREFWGTDEDADMVTERINYRFGPLGAPLVAARY
jgi:hypothetical protein